MSGPGDAADKAILAARAGAALVVAVGGDGTLHEVVDGVLSEGREDLPALGLVPVGTGNDFARALGVHGLGVEAATRVLLHGEARPVDALRLIGTDHAGGRGAEHAINNLGVAYPALANSCREQTRRLPGQLSYLVGGFIARARFQPAHLSVTVDDVTVSGRFLLVHVGSGPCCGAGIRFTPAARHDDGKLDVAIVAERTKLGALLDWPRISRGALHDDVALLQGKRVRIHGPKGFEAHVDGEIRHVPQGVLEITLVPGAVRIVHPHASTAALVG
jgi:YegS/Rv2252/BmrU family lipid kinase